MPVLRDVLATFSVLVDDKPLTKLDRRIDKLKDRIRTFSAYGATAFGAAAYGAFQLTERASDAEEALNVLQATFKANSQAVVDWSKVTGKAMQRSEYSLQKAAGDFGKFLRPTLEGTNADIVLMSENLTKLGVDLASFHNTSDEEAMMRLFSGLSGETEAVRRLGINISDEALTALNKSRGDSRSTTQLSLAEKTMLRYEKILMDSTDAQGDAVRSANRWAGQLKELKERLKTIGIEVGKRLMPVMLNLLRRIQPLIDKLLKAWDWLENKTSSLRAAFVQLGGAITAYGIVKLIELTKANWHLIQSLAHSTTEIFKQKGGWQALASSVSKAAAQFLIIEDAITFLRGGDSWTGRLFGMLTKSTQPLMTLAYLFERLSAKIRDAGAYMLELGRRFAMVAKAAGQATVGNFKGASKSLDSAGKSEYVSESAKLDTENDMREQRKFKALEQGDLQGYLTNRSPLDSEQKAYSVFMTERQKLVDKRLSGTLAGESAKNFKFTNEDVGSKFLTEEQFQFETTGTRTRTKSAPAGASSERPTKIVNMGSISITVDKEATAEKIKQLIIEEQERQLRAAHAADGEESD